jgi:hypothetical protein
MENKMTNEMRETLRRLDAFLKEYKDHPRQEKAPAAPVISQPSEKEALADRLCLIAGLFHALLQSETDKRCLLIKRSEIQSNCKSQKLDFLAVEKLAETRMSENTKGFYHECIKDQH